MYHVVESFEEGTITWMAPPRVYPEPVAVFVVAPGIGGMQPASYTVDLTAHVAAALAGGAQQLSLAILPDDAVLAYRRLWNSRETLPEDPFTASPLGPVLEVVFGAPPASLTAAERDASR